MSTHFSRRTFLGAAAAAGLGSAAVAAPGAGRPAPRRQSPQDAPAAIRPKPRRTLRKAVMYGMISEGATVVERFKILRDCGFAGVEMDSPSDIPTDEILRASGDTGIKVHGLVDSAHWKYPLNHPAPEVRARGQDALRKCLSDAKTLDVTSILLVPAVVTADAPYDEAYRLSQELIKDVLPQAQAANVKIGIENVWNGFLLSPLECGQYIDDFSSPAMGFHFDIGNCINFGYPDQWIRLIAERIVKLHIKDFSRSKRDKEGLWKGFDVELGEGDAQWSKVMAELDAIGYSTDLTGRWATAEVRGGDRKRLQQIGDQMDRLFAL